VKVFWTDTAVNHLSSIYTYISQNSPQYAQRLVERLTQRSEQIVKFPFSGRIVPEFETEQIREIIEGSYRIIYYILISATEQLNNKIWMLFSYQHPYQLLKY